MNNTELLESIRTIVKDEVRTVVKDEVRIIVKEEVKAIVSDEFSKIDEKFDKIDGKFDKVDEKFDKIDQKFDKIDERFNALDKKIDDTKDLLQHEINYVGILLEQHISDTRDFGGLLAETRNDVSIIKHRVEKIEDRLSLHELAIKNSRR